MEEKLKPVDQEFIRVRAIKPGVPLIGQEDIPLRDMFKLQKDLTAGDAHCHGRLQENLRPESFL